MNNTLTGHVYDDGGRSAYFKAVEVGDCVTRAIAIATGQDYLVVYNALQMIEKDFSKGRSKAALRARGKSVRNGTSKETAKRYLASLGWVWKATMGIGTGTTVHLRASELPKGRLVVACSGHYVAVVDGVIHDTYDPSRGGKRAVYGYWTK